MKVCPECGKILFYNSYFEKYICHDCGWIEKKDICYYDKNDTRGKKSEPVLVV